MESARVVAAGFVVQVNGESEETVISITLTQQPASATTVRSSDPWCQSEAFHVRCHPKPSSFKEACQALWGGRCHPQTPVSSTSPLLKQLSHSIRTLTLGQNLTTCTSSVGYYMFSSLLGSSCASCEFGTVPATQGHCMSSLHMPHHFAAATTAAATNPPRSRCPPSPPPPAPQPGGSIQSPPALCTASHMQPAAGQADVIAKLPIQTNIARPLRPVSWAMFACSLPCTADHAIPITRAGQLCVIQVGSSHRVVLGILQHPPALPSPAGRCQAYMHPGPASQPPTPPAHLVHPLQPLSLLRHHVARHTQQHV